MEIHDAWASPAGQDAGSWHFAAVSVGLSFLLLLMATPEGDAGRQIQTFLTAELSAVGLEVVSRNDVGRLAGLAQQRAAFGCRDDDDCLKQLGESLNVAYLVTTHLSRAGEELVLLLALIDTRTQRTAARVIVSAPNVGILLGKLPASARELSVATDGKGARTLVSEVRVDKGVIKPPPIVDAFVDDRAPKAAELGRALTASLTSTLDDRATLKVVGRDDIVRALPDGDDVSTCLDDEACLESVAGALDVDLSVVAGVGSLDGVPVVSLTVLNIGEARAYQRLAAKAPALEDVEATLVALASRLEVPGERVLVNAVDVDPAVFPLADERTELGPLPLASLQLGAGLATVGLLSCVPGLNCVAFPFVPGIGALLQVYVGNSFGKRRARVFWPVVASYLAWLPVFGALPALVLAATGLQNLIAPTSANDQGQSAVGAAITFMLPLAFIVAAAAVSQIAVTAAFALGANVPRSDVDELGVDLASVPLRAPPRARTQMAMVY